MGEGEGEGRAELGLSDPVQGAKTNTPITKRLRPVREMCSLTDESKQSADPAASRLSGSLCRIFPLCLVKLYHPVLAGNSCGALPIIHIRGNVSCKCILLRELHPPDPSQHGGK